ncbi:MULTISPECIES: dynamin family protein [Glycomyces]|jgi:predicted GTPase|uniref:50S ribosome-binding GTPase n=1 Tax=Glycomyces niveus TaxID=2820287 RepID=A0ABS3U0F0_9ACTN|nr:dynamin family protein [Glycomyces sp. NEAU-S30]MBO3732246.1 50S ribosome-binding GTPase [Glycomyces sp. NEAU-S30]
MTDTATPPPAAKPAAAPVKKAAATPAKPNPAQQIHKLCARAAKAGNASLRTVDAKAAAEVDEVARWQPDKPVAVVVGETKRGKSSLVNALLGMPGLSPVDAQVATTAYLEFAWAEQASVRAWQPGAADPMLLGVGDLRNWATRLGTMPPGMVPPRRMLVGHPSALLKHMSVVDTPGTGGLDPDHAQIALEAVARATCLIMVTDASSPMAKTELDFLTEASKRVNFVVFALTKTDTYPGWRTVMEENRSLIEAHAPRFRNAPHYPVSAMLAEHALNSTGPTRQALAKESGIGKMQRALVKVATAGKALVAANVVRAVRTEFQRLAVSAAADMKAYDPDPEAANRLKEEKKQALASRRTETKKANLALRVETQRAKIEVQGRLRTHLQELEEALLDEVEKANKAALESLPNRVDIALQGIAARLSGELHQRFVLLAERVLRQVFNDDELRQATNSISAGLRTAASGRARRGDNSDGALLVASSAGVAMMAGRAVTMGAGAIGLGAVAGVGAIALTASGVGIGLAAAAFLLYRRKIQGNRQAAKQWIQRVIAEARANLNEEISFRFTEVEFVFNSTLDDALERRAAEFDARISAAENAQKADQAARAKKQAALKQRRDSMAAKVKQLDEVLAKARTLVPGEEDA